MKQILVVAAFILSFTITASYAPVFAQEISSDPTISLPPSTTILPLSTTPVITIENKEIQYDLPYPGILPDNPLYVLKVIRDKIEGFFISDPLQKASFDVSQSDKRMNASIYLSEEKPTKDALISSTVSKALNYYEQAISETQQAREQGEDISSFINRMDTAAQKYHQLLLQLQTTASPTLKLDLNGDKQRVDTLRSTVTGMEKKAENH